jgi:glycosyltransferase involved in cell wall biosynthesis
VDLGIPAESVIVQHNGVDGTRFFLRDREEARRRQGVPPDRRVACFVGNLVPEKGPDILIEALSRLDPSVLRSLRMVFIGEGPLKEKLLASAERLGISKAISFIGRRSPQDVAWWIAASDVVCLPSRREGCPNVVLEALASGRPVVAAAVGGVPELLNPHNGLLALPEDPEAFADALELALKREWNPTDLRRSVGSLSWENTGRVLHTTLLEALASGPMSRRW